MALDYTPEVQGVYGEADGADTCCPDARNQLR